MSAASVASSIGPAVGRDRVRALQRVLYRSAKQDPERRFHALFDKVARSDVMWRAWMDVRANKGAPGVDGMGIEAIESSGEAGAQAFLDDLAAELRAGRYRPQPLRRVHIPKPGSPGQTRPLGIPTVRDRVVMAAAKVVLEPGLAVSPQKTRIVELTKGKEGFDFLGFHLRKMESWKWRGKWYLQRWPSARAMNSIRAKIRELTSRRYTGLAIATVVERINPVLRGWGNYFRGGNSARKFTQIDAYVHERLALLAAKKHKRSGRRWAAEYNLAWFQRLGVHTLNGSVRYGAAHASR